MTELEVLADKLGKPVDFLYAIMNGRQIKTNSTISAEKIAEIVCNYYGCEIEDLKSNSRKVEIIILRKHFAYFARTEAKLSLKEVGKMIGKDHATILNYCNFIEGKIQVYPDEFEVVNELREIIELHKC
jgi:chromosomal replication initiation ATPase DnaA